MNVDFLEQTEELKGRRMTQTEEKIGKAMGALMLMGIGWIGTAIMANSNVVSQNHVALAENKVLILQVQKDIHSMKITQNDAMTRISDLEARMASQESSMKYIGKKMGL